MNRQVDLNRTHGFEPEKSVSELAREWGAEAMLAWAEPESDYCQDGHPGRIPGFAPLVVGVPNWPEAIPLAEARVFWPDRALHIVADPVKGCRWAYLEEVEGESYLCTEKTVFLLRDQARFGLELNVSGNLDLAALEYFQEGGLKAWRLVIREGKNA
ncbi:MAG: hypothetical protein HZB71_11315 [Betaproteobacteria bacterium]|nr:hypothetical protein [Betaproteobacteria bacterium]